MIFLSGEDSDALDLAIEAEDASQILLGVGVGEALDEEVALLLRVLEALLLAKDLSLTLRSGESRLNVELEAIEFLFMEVVDSSLGAFGTVVALAWAIKADKGKWLVSAILVNLSHDSDRFNVSILRESVSNILLGPVRVEVLDIDIVEDLGCIIALLNLECLEFDVIKLGGKGSLSVLRGLETNETVPIGNRWRSKIG